MNNIVGAAVGAIVVFAILAVAGWALSRPRSHLREHPRFYSRWYERLYMWGANRKEQ